MANHLSYLLAQWQASEAGIDWVLGTVYKTEGSAYRKAGAMMLINSLGQQLGLLSGGCLDADIVLNAKKVMQTGSTMMLEYDGSDEDDLSFQLGIGCGGKVYIMLQAVSPDRDLGLNEMAEALRHRDRGNYYQKIGVAEGYFKKDDARFLKRSVIEQGWLITPIHPEPHLLLIGGGMDALPVVRIAKELGWQITLVDPRPANARAEFFASADRILKKLDEHITAYVNDNKVDAAIIMSHNIDLDATGLKLLQSTQIKYIALLGPKHRYRQVLDRAGLLEGELTCQVTGPAGLDIGGQLPESIALSMLAECHKELHRELSVPKAERGHGVIPIAIPSDALDVDTKQNLLDFQEINNATS